MDVSVLRWSRNELQVPRRARCHVECQLLRHCLLVANGEWQGCDDLLTSGEWSSLHYYPDCRCCWRLHAYKTAQRLVLLVGRFLLDGKGLLRRVRMEGGREGGREGWMDLLDPQVPCCPMVVDAMRGWSRTVSYRFVPHRTTKSFLRQAFCV